MYVMDVMDVMYAQVCRMALEPNEERREYADMDVDWSRGGKSSSKRSSRLFDAKR